MTIWSTSASCKGKQCADDHAKVTSLVFAGIKNWKSQYLENANLGEISAITQKMLQK